MSGNLRYLLAVCFALVSFSCGKAVPPPAEASAPALESSDVAPVASATAAAEKLHLKTKSVSLYYKHRQFDALYAVPGKIFDHPNPENCLLQLIDQLSIQPKDKKALVLWPKNTSVREAYLLAPDTIVVDFQRNFLNSFSVGAGTEEYLVYSLVNSILVNYPNYKKVQLLVDGEVEDSFLGHIDVESPLTKQELYTIIPEYSDENRIQVEDLEDPPEQP